MKKLVIHIGLRKTGSSALQELFGRNAALLRDHGIAYPDRMQGFPAHQELAWALMSPRPAYVPEDLSREDVYDHYCAVIDDNIRNGLTTLLSSEDISLLSMNHSALRYLHDRFAEYDPHIVYYQRDPIGYHISNYKHAIAAGRFTESFSTYLFRVQTLIYAHPALTKNIWSNVFGEEHIQPLAYTAPGEATTSNFVHFLREVFGVELQDEYRNYRSNTGIPNEAIDYFLGLNRSDLTDEEIKRVKNVVRKTPLPSDDKGFLDGNLSVEQLNILREIYG